MPSIHCCHVSKKIAKISYLETEGLAELLHQVVHEACTNQTQSSRHTVFTKHTMLLTATFASSLKKLAAKRHSLAEVWHFQEARFIQHSIPWNVFSIFFRQHCVYFSMQAALVELLPWY